MIDAKKLIAGFLILAAGASSSVFIFSYLSAPAAGTELAANSNPSPIGDNAFLAQNTDENLSPEITNSPDNITGILTGTVLTGIMDANPNGPVTDANGNQIATPPNQAAMLAELSNSAALKNFKAPDWDAEAAAQKLNLVSESASATLAYKEALRNVFEKYIVQPDLQDVIQSASGDPSALAIAAPALSNALAEAVQIPTPPTLINFQKSFVKFLTYEQNVLKVAQNATTDPVKASLILQAENNKQQTALNQFKNELEKAPLINLSLNTVPSSLGEHNNNFIGFVNSIFGVPRVYAQFVVFDPTIFGKMVLEYAQELALQLLKNELINVVQNKVLAWVQGSGAPRFITSWADTFINAYTATAINALNGITPNLCPAFGPLINVALNITTPSAGYGFQTCTMSTANMKNFYNDFANGGWNSYFNMLQPNNNFYSGLMRTQDTVEAAASNQLSATQAKSVAASGFSGSKVCADVSNPDGTSLWCVDNETGERTLAPADGCPAGSQELTVPNGGLCADGTEPKTTTPGQVTAEISAKALGSNIDLIVNANNLMGILVAMTESLMNSLINSAQNAIDSGLAGIQPSPPPANNTPTSTPLSCAPRTTTATAGTSFSIGAMGGNPDPGGNINYAWAAPGANPENSTGPMFSGIYNTTGTYNIYLTDQPDNGTTTCNVVVQ